MDGVSMQSLQTATHRALAIPEIIREIFTTMSTPQTPPVSRYPPWGAPNEFISPHYPMTASNAATLANCATTCQQFAEPALDVLWETSCSLIPLLRIVGLQRNTNGVWSFDEGFDDTQWERLKSYAKRIHHLLCRQPEELNPVILLRVAYHLEKTAYLLPELQTLVYPNSPHLFLLASDKLRMIDITPTDVQAWNQFFPTLTTTTLPFTMSINAVQRIPPQLSQLPYLSALLLYSINTPNHKGISDLFAIESLECLGLSFMTSQPRIPPPPAHERLSYQIHTLFISATFQIMDDVLAHLSATSLTKVDIRSNTSYRIRSASLGSSRTWTPRLDFWSSSLTHVQLENSWFNDSKSLMQDMLVLRPLLDLKKLEYLGVKSKAYLDPSDADYDAMSHAWPAMVSLHLDFELHTVEIQRVKVTPRATLSALESFAKNCPKLIHLVMYVDLSKVPLSPAPLCHPLATLYIPGNISCDTATFIRYLLRLFPNLRSLIEDLEPANHSDEARSDWAQMDRFLRLCRDSRLGKV